MEMDPFQNQREQGDDPFDEQKDIDKVAGGEDMAMGTSPTDNRRLSKEWGKSDQSPLIAKRVTIPQATCSLRMVSFH